MSSPAYTPKWQIITGFTKDAEREMSDADRDIGLRSLFKEVVAMARAPGSALDARDEDLHRMRLAQLRDPLVERLVDELVVHFRRDAAPRLRVRLQCRW